MADDRDLITELFAARRHLGHVGSNLNQVARVLNSGGQPPETRHRHLRHPTGGPARPGRHRPAHRPCP
ncbi:plasmid mobilization relaxosome protein MobC [Streptomyces sp. NPDC002838]|uniref:plasmid mobilization relaxosome protein MobC n=1 Tax=Streptomyces sp. NPDC002838 TaxID=3154436 RepID=UPI00332139C2